MPELNLEQWLGLDRSKKEIMWGYKEKQTDQLKQEGMYVRIMSPGSETRNDNKWGWIYSTT